MSKQHFLKYECTPTQWATARKKIEKTGTDPEGETYTYWNPDLVAVLVDLGCLCQEWGTDEEGNQTYASSRTQRFPLTSFGLVSPLGGLQQYLICLAESRWRFFNGVHAGHRVRSSVLRSESECSILPTTTTANKSFLNKH
jgi:hypothetical protein